MPPEVAENLVVLDLRLENGIVMARSERLYAFENRRLLMSWYSETCPSGYVPVFDGVLYVKEATIADRSETASVRVPNGKGTFTWRDYCDAFVLLFPDGVSIADPEPIPTEAKAFNGRLAVLWVQEQSLQLVSLSHRKLDRAVHSEATRINERVRSEKRGNVLVIAPFFSLLVPPLPYPLWKELLTAEPTTFPCEMEPLLHLR